MLPIPYKLVWWPDGKGGKVCWYMPETDYMPPNPKYHFKDAVDLASMRDHAIFMRERRDADDLIDREDMYSLDHPDAKMPTGMGWEEDPHANSRLEARRQSCTQTAAVRLYNAGLGYLRPILFAIARNGWNKQRSISELCITRRWYDKGLEKILNFFSAQ